MGENAGVNRALGGGGVGQAQHNFMLGQTNDQLNLPQTSEKPIVMMDHTQTSVNQNDIQSLVGTSQDPLTRYVQELQLEKDDTHTNESDRVGFDTRGRGTRHAAPSDQNPVPKSAVFSASANVTKRKQWQIKKEPYVSDLEAVPVTKRKRINPHEKSLLMKQKHP